MTFNGQKKISPSRDMNPGHLGATQTTKQRQSPFSWSWNHRTFLIEFFRPFGGAQGMRELRSTSASHWPWPATSKTLLSASSVTSLMSSSLSLSSSTSSSSLSPSSSRISTVSDSVTFSMMMEAVERFSTLSYEGKGKKTFWVDQRMQSSHALLG